jgi:hypothetical protein
VTLTIAVNSMSGQSLVVLLVTNSVEQSPRQKANSSTPSQEVSLYAFMEPEGSLPYSQKLDPVPVLNKINHADTLENISLTL